MHPSGSLRTCGNHLCGFHLFGETRAVRTASQTPQASRAHVHMEGRATVLQMGLHEPPFLHLAVLIQNDTCGNPSKSVAIALIQSFNAASYFRVKKNHNFFILSSTDRHSLYFLFFTLCYKQCCNKHPYTHSLPTRAFTWTE